MSPFLFFWIIYFDVISTWGWIVRLTILKMVGGLGVVLILCFWADLPLLSNHYRPCMRYNSPGEPGTSVAPTAPTDLVGIQQMLQKAKDKLNQLGAQPSIIYSVLNFLLMKHIPETQAWFPCAFTITKALLPSNAVQTLRIQAQKLHLNQQMRDLKSQDMEVKVTQTPPGETMRKILWSS